MEKYCASVKVKCGEEFTFYTDKKILLETIEGQAVTQAFLHERNCSKCASIRIYEKERSSVWRVETNTKCGKILYEERTNPSEVEKASCERGVCQQFAEHRKTCLKCIRMKKLDQIECQTK